MQYNKVLYIFLFLISIATVMRASGCDVPEYMLAMKKHSKKERRKLERTAPERDTILTVPKYKQHVTKKLHKKNAVNIKKVTKNTH